MRAFNNLTGQDVAIKMTHRVTDETVVVTSLEYEMAVYKLIPDGTHGFPSIHYAGKDANHHVLVMDMLGPDLDAIRRACRGKFTLRTVCMLAGQMVRLAGISPAIIRLAYSQAAMGSYRGCSSCTREALYAVTSSRRTLPWAQRTKIRTQCICSTSRIPRCTSTTKPGNTYHFKSAGIPGGRFGMQAFLPITDTVRSRPNLSPCYFMFTVQSRGLAARRHRVAPLRPLGVVSWLSAMGCDTYR